MNIFKRIFGKTPKTICSHKNKQVNIRVIRYNDKGKDVEYTDFWECLDCGAANYDKPK